MSDSRSDPAVSHRRLPLVRAIAASAGLAAAWIGCDAADPAPVSSGSGAPALPPVESPATLGAVVVPPFDPRPAVPLALAPMPPIPVEEEPPPPLLLPAATAPLRSTVMAASDATAAPSHPPLDLLLRPAREPGPAPRSVDLRTQPPAAAPAPAPPGAFERWKRQMRLERRSEPIGPAGARQGTHSEIEAALRVPLDEDVSLEGGVRVDQRDEPGAKKTPERQSTPRVGVEVRF